MYYSDSVNKSVTFSTVVLSLEQLTLIYCLKFCDPNLGICVAAILLLNSFCKLKWEYVSNVSFCWNGLLSVLTEAPDWAMVPLQQLDDFYFLSETDKALLILRGGW